MSYHRSNSSSETNNGASSSSSAPHGQSPMDWTNFMNFSSTPGNAAKYHAPQKPHDPSASSNDDYQAFAQGIAMSQPDPMRFQNPRMSGSHLQVPEPHRQPHTSPHDKPSSSDPTNGLSLDPSTFSRDIRFQVPSFISNQVGGAPTFPPGGEAWSGFSGQNVFGSADATAANLTPGSMFGTYHGATGEYDRNVLEGLSGFMNENGWDNGWNEQKEAPGTMSYINPNPSPNVLAKSQAGKTVPKNEPKRSPRIDTSVPRQQSAASGTMPTSAILPQSTGFEAPSLSPSQNLSTVNIASSSTQPYAPPSNTQSLLQGPSLPSNLMGTSLTDGPGLYSTTGFDMVGILSRVANRKDPKTQLGPVDLSCSFIVVDIRRYDSPIVYASPTFTSLTGYELPQMLGRNCRFLQSPEGEVIKGSKRKYTDNVAVAHFKRMLNAGKECQASLINYRRGGMPFINLVTVIPIPWEGSEIVYHVGFQVDLVEQPNAILRNMRDGSYQVNYTVANIPQQPTLRPPGRDIGGLNQDVLNIMGTRIDMPGFATGEDGGKSEWLKMLFENADDFVHVLSLKGMFQYVSPSVRRVLEYEPEDLMNKNISDICHPSDIVPLMRTLKDSTHAPTDSHPARTVNLVFRVRRKSSGYVWLECAGKLHVEPGKGRKAVILTGRARSVPTLPWEIVSRHGGLAENEFWLKTSFEGLILHTTSTIELLGRKSNDVVGQSIYSLCSDRTIVGALRQAVSNEVVSGAVTTRHQMVNGTGAYIDVMTVIYSPRALADVTNSDSESEPSRSSSLSTAGVRPSTLVVQVKILPTSSHPVVHAASSNVFEELETTRGTSWQYELHQLRLLNRRLKEDIAAFRSGGRGNKGKKRKEVSSRVAEQFSATPRHQLAPGFGLVAPGLQGAYYR